MGREEAAEPKLRPTVGSEGEGEGGRGGGEGEGGGEG